MISYKKQILFLVIIALSCAAVLINIYREIRREDIAELTYRQTVHARQAAKGIETFFDDTQRILRYLAHDRRVIRLDDVGKARIRSLYNIYGGMIVSITRVDARKRILYTFPEEKHVKGADISHQEHIREIFRTREPVVSDVSQRFRETGRCLSCPGLPRQNLRWNDRLFALFRPVGEEISGRDSDR